jgi:hypothetical protein
MKDTDQNAEIAKLDGWTLFDSGKDSFGVWCEAHATREHEGILQDKLPLYLTSYDALVPVIKRQIEDGAVNQLDFALQLNAILPDGEIARYPLTIFATPSQLCEALLRAAGKWKE